MTQKTSIEWTDRSANPIRARNKLTGKVGWHCVHHGPGCLHCYAEKLNRWRGTGLPFLKPSGELVETFLDERVLNALMKLRGPQRVFLCDMTDIFGDWVSDEWLDRIFATMALTPHITYQVLTKRAERMRAYLQQVSDERDMQRWAGAACDLLGTPDALTVFDDLAWPLANVWAGVSVENQATAEERIPHLLRTPAAMRFLSCEPLLGAIEFGAMKCGYLFDGEGATYYDALRGYSFWGSGDFGVHGPAIDWVIVGGESGPSARPMHPDWARSIRDHCQAAGVPFFFKQWGGLAPIDDDTPRGVPLGFVQPDGHVSMAISGYEPGCPCDHSPREAPMVRLNKKAAGRMLDGREWNEFPAATEAPAR